MSVFTRRLTVKGKRQAGSGVTYRGPRIAALDYRTGTGAFNVTTHQKYDISIIGMLRTQTGVGQSGYNFVQSLKTANPNIKIFQYAIATQMFWAGDGFTGYQEISDLIDAGGTSGGSWWAKDAATGRKTKTGNVTAYSSWEVNISDDVTPNANGRRATQEVARFYHTNYGISNLYAVGLTGVFQDNVWGAPGSSTSSPTVDSTGANLAANKCADYNLDGTNDSLGLIATSQRTTAPAPNFRKGNQRFVTEIKSLQASAKVMANADFDNRDDATYGNSSLAATEMTGVYDYAFLEGFNGASYAIESYRNIFADTMRRYSTTEANVTQGVVCNTYINSSTQSLSRRLQHARYGLAMTMLRDGYHCCVDQATNPSVPFWFNEIDPAFVPIGNRVGASGGTTQASGIVMQTYENGCVLVNPVANKGKQVSSPAGSSIQRSGNVVTLVCSTLTGLATGDKIRIVDCVNSTFNGTFTLTSASGGTFTWNQTAADVALISRPSCFAQVKSTVDLTGQGYKRFLGTDDAHNDYDNGTSQNDGTAAGVVTLWSGDGLILLKQ